MAEQHLIASCKVFLPLTQAYWQNGASAIPQILVTDTFVQDAYGLSWSGQQNDAAILASYTWEDDALKLLAMNDQAVIQAVTAKLNDITTSTLNNSFSQYVDTSRQGQVFQWTMQPTYHGCAKLYRQRNWEQCYALMTYNQTYSASSHLYFAGESYGTEGGWTEPALRMALDAVMNLVNNSGGSFTNAGFSFANDYPGFMTDFTPNETYPQNNATA
jgi:tryptophan 2-monooxygenase